MLKLAPASPALPRDARDTLFLLAVIALIVLPQVANLPLVVQRAGGRRAALARHAGRAGAAAARPLVAARPAGRHAGRHLRRRTARCSGRDAGVTLIVVLLALKTLELRARRDAFVIFFLGFFTMLTNFFYSQSLLTALRDAARAAGPADRAGQRAHAGGPAAAARRRRARPAGWRCWARRSWLVLFMLFPRFAPLWGMPERRHDRAQRPVDARCGGQHRAAGARRQHRRCASSSTATAAAAARPVLPRPGAVAVRRPRVAAAAAAPVRARAALPAEPAACSGAPVRYEVTLEPNNRPWLLALDAAPPAPEVPGYEAVDDAASCNGSRTAPVTDLLRYRAESYTHFRQRARSAARRRCSRIPARCRPASTRAPLALAAADARATRRWPAPTRRPSCSAALRTAAHRRLHLHAGARRLRRATRPTSSGSTARKASASTSPRPSWC